ncbi:hypothetical protein M0802_003969 [Mischocyttarus mexicanus]|nr:hypothetical protein M0802_003969 [Mischocyttarus mexicanus]
MKKKKKKKEVVEEEEEVEATVGPTLATLANATGRSSALAYQLAGSARLPGGARMIYSVIEHPGCRGRNSMDTPTLRNVRDLPPPRQPPPLHSTLLHSTLLRSTPLHSTTPPPPPPPPPPVPAPFQRMFMLLAGERGERAPPRHRLDRGSLVPLLECSPPFASQPSTSSSSSSSTYSVELESPRVRALHTHPVAYVSSCPAAGGAAAAVAAAAFATTTAFAAAEKLKERG